MVVNKSLVSRKQTIHVNRVEKVDNYEADGTRFRVYTQAFDKFAPRQLPTESVRLLYQSAVSG